MKLARAALLCVPALGVLELGLHLYFARRAPAFDAWASVKPAVSELKRDGDLVVIAPGWSDPLARAALGDELMPIRDVARPDTSRYEGAVEVSILGQHDAEIGGWREESRRDVGQFLVRRLANPAPARVVFDFTDHAHPPIADVRGTEPEVACIWNANARIEAGGLGGHPTFPPQRFECPGGVFFNVGVTVIADQDFRPRRCLWSHPLPRGEIVTRFTGVPLGAVIRGHGGMYWIIERERKGAPITLAVRVDGDTVGETTHRDGDGWSAFEFPLGAHAGAAVADVEFAVRTPNYAHRHFCFEADTR